jgi:hypothetical protein
VAAIVLKLENWLRTLEADDEVIIDDSAEGPALRCVRNPNRYYPIGSLSTISMRSPDGTVETKVFPPGGGTVEFTVKAEEKTP